MNEEKVVQTAEKGGQVKRKVRPWLLAAMLAAMLCGSALATGESGGGDLTAVTGAMSTLTSIVSSVFSMLTSNPLLVVFLAAGLLGVGIRVFQRLKGAASGS